jgi:hypothetical protein
MSSVPVFVAFLGAVLFYAAIWGAAPERLVALSYMIASAGSLLFALSTMPGQFRVVPVHLLIVDILLLAALCVIAVRANRLWPIPAASCQLVAVLVHAGKLVHPEMIPNGYAFLVTIWSWPMLLLLALGTRAHQRRLAEGLTVPDWKPSSALPASQSRARGHRD